MAGAGPTGRHIEKRGHQRVEGGKGGLWAEFGVLGWPKVLRSFEELLMAAEDVAEATGHHSTIRGHRGGIGRAHV